jgi:Protein of unknown function (DUF4231)
MSAAPTRPDSDADAQPGSGSGNCVSVLQPMVRIGVTGHRDLADEAAVSKLVIDGVRTVLQIMDAAIRPKGIHRITRPSAAPVGYQIVSPLAEGADRIAADLIFCDDPDLSARPRELVVPLPFSLNFYRGSDGQRGSDCSDAASRAQFDRLQRVACWTRTLNTRDPSDQEEREVGYHEVGKFVTAHSDVLLALWDGSDNQTKGGTAAIVWLALRRGVPVVWVPVTRRGLSEAGTPSDAIAECRLLFEAEAWGGSLEGLPRAQRIERAAQSSALLTSPMAARVLRSPRRAVEPDEEPLVERLKRLEELERFAGTRPGPRSATDRPPAAEDLSAESTTAAYTSQLLANAAQWIEVPYARADGLAKAYQSRLRHISIGVYAAAATAVALGAFAAILFPYGGNWRLPVIFEALVLVVMLVLQSLDVRRTWRDRWVEYRAMAECMRVRHYLALVTPKLPTGLDFDHMARPSSWSAGPSPAQWFAPTLERLWERRPDVDRSRLSFVQLRDYVVADWVQGQIEYHKRARDSHMRLERIFQRVIRIVLYATLLAVVLHAIRGYAPAFLGRTTGRRDLIAALLAFLAIVLTSVAAAFTGYSGQQRHGFHHARFRRMATELAGISAVLQEANSLEELKRSIGEVSRVMMGETTDWFQDMLDQILESPT